MKSTNQDIPCSSCSSSSSSSSSSRWQ